VQAATVVVGQNEWRQLTETTGFTWEQVNAICGAGPCSFDGWIWAGLRDVQLLFDALIEPGSVQFPPAECCYTAPLESEDIRAALLPPYFEPIFSHESVRSIEGWVRDTFPPDFRPFPFYFSAMMIDYTGRADFVLIGPIIPGGFVPSGGVWLYRPLSTPISEPSSLATSTLALLCLLFLTCRSAANR
jgi:hypothetical protein